MISETKIAGLELLLAQGVAGLDTIQLSAAAELLRQAIESDPLNAKLFCRLGECSWRLGDFAGMVQAFERAIKLDPDDLATYRSAADAATTLARRVAAAGDQKRSRDLLKFAAMYLVALARRQHLDRLDSTETSLREAIALDPKSAEAYAVLGAFYQSRGQHVAAEKPLRRAIALDPALFEGYFGLGNVHQSLGRFDEMEAAYRKALSLKPSLHSLRQSLGSIPLMNMLYDENNSADDIYVRHRSWGEAVLDDLRKTGTEHSRLTNSRDPDRKLRIAFLSGDFKYHAVSFFFQPLLVHHDRDELEIYCFAEIERPDPVTKFLHDLGGVWRNTYGNTDDIVRAQLRADEIDIAIDLAGHSANNRLHALAARPAPVTATWLGYPATTGLPTMDWRITDAIADPPGQEHFHTEQLMRLPNVFLCYSLFMTDMPDVAPVPALTNGLIRFGSFNNPQKISASTVATWARILAAVPRSRLAFKHFFFVEPILRQRLLQRFVAHGIDADRLEFRDPHRDFGAHLRSYDDIDVALDPFPYNGTTTTCEAMWMGVPMVSLIGDHHASRVGLDLLTQVGLTELAASDQQSYIATAIALAQDLPRLQRLRGELRERMRASPLCNAPRFARAFEAALREMWRQWCQS